MEVYKDMYQFKCGNLDIQTQRLQENKVERTFTHMLESIQKHFHPWVNRHLPIFLFSKSQTARAVVSFIFHIYSCLITPNATIHHCKGKK